MYLLKYSLFLVFYSLFIKIDFVIQINALCKCINWFVIRKSYAALRNLVTSLPNPNSDPNPMLSGQVESESESEKTSSDPHHCTHQNTYEYTYEYTHENIHE
jgi:hypothetical protein